MKNLLIALPLVFLVGCETLKGSRDPNTGVTTITESDSGTTLTVQPTGDSEIDTITSMGSDVIGLATGETGIAAILGALAGFWMKKRKDAKATA